MATYYQGDSNIQGADGLQTLVLMNPSFVQYSDTPQPAPTGNVVFLNSAASSLTRQSIPHVPPPLTQHLVGIPLQAAAAATSQDPNSHPMHGQQDISPMHGFPQRVQYNLGNPMDPNTVARETLRAQKGLSLSLSPKQHGFRSLRDEREVPSQSQAGARSAENMRVSGRSASGVTNGISTMQNVMLGSKYLKAAQELLEEVVNASGRIKSELLKKADHFQGKWIKESVAASGDISAVGDTSVKPSTELSTGERQEIQMKKAKLISMLDEVEQRYREYHHRMLIVISSFEQAVGIGSAKTYTSLALKTISKQFKCLKDAIMGQIRAANKSLGEENSLGVKIEGSRLKFVDHQLRQQRALQHLGMIQHNAWRPQRGLPERAVSLLRAWLFEHFLHPYPKDSDKIMLARQTGLTRSQVSNWFINARVRLWKPMVEEMYQEELKENEKNGLDETASKNEKKDIGSASKSTDVQEKNYTSQSRNKNSSSKKNTESMQRAIPTSMASAAHIGGSVQKQSGFTRIGGSELEGITQGSPKKQRSIEMLQSHSNAPTMSINEKSLCVNNQQVSRDGYSMMEGSPANFTGGYGQYSMGELGRFETEQFTPGFSGNNFSLSLGLPPCDYLSLSGNHQNFHSIPLGRRVDIGESNDFGSMNTSASHSAAAFDNIDIQNCKRFAAPLLPDFVT